MKPIYYWTPKEAKRELFFTLPNCYKRELATQCLSLTIFEILQSPTLNICHYCDLLMTQNLELLWVGLAFMHCPWVLGSRGWFFIMMNWRRNGAVQAPIIMMDAGARSIFPQGRHFGSRGNDSWRRSSPDAHMDRVTSMWHWHFFACQTIPSLPLFPSSFWMGSTNSHLYLAMAYWSPRVCLSKWVKIPPTF